MIFCQFRLGRCMRSMNHVLYLAIYSWAQISWEVSVLTFFQGCIGVGMVVSKPVGLYGLINILSYMIGFLWRCVMRAVLDWQCPVRLVCHWSAVQTTNLSDDACFQKKWAFLCTWLCMICFEWHVTACIATLTTKSRLWLARLGKMCLNLAAACNCGRDRLHSCVELAL